jgi:hypothetical protein
LPAIPPSAKATETTPSATGDLSTVKTHNGTKITVKA